MNRFLRQSNCLQIAQLHRMPNNSYSEKKHDDAALDELIYSNPDGDYYKLEEQSSFTSLSPRAPENFSENLQNIYKKRTENLTAGRMINHGMPFSEEERDDLAKKYAEGLSIEILSDFYQRTVNAIETRLEQPRKKLRSVLF